MWQNILKFLKQIPTIYDFIAIGLGVLTVYWEIRRRKKKKYKTAFMEVCTLPATRISSYENVYKKLDELYKDQFKGTGLLKIDSDYFDDRISMGYSKLQTSIKFKKNQDFPLAYQREWLLGNNKDLRISIQGTLDSSPYDAASTPFAEPAHEFLAQFEQKTLADFLGSLKGKELWNDPTFDIRELISSKDPQELAIRFRLGHYHDYVNSYEIVARELYYFLYLKKKLSLKTLKIRNTVPIKELYHFQKRPAKLGINVFVLLKKTSGSYCTFIQLRGDKQVEYPGFYHVAPAGTFQPLDKFEDPENVRFQFKFSYTVLRELLEEIFGFEKAGRNGCPPWEIFNLSLKNGFCPGEFLLGADKVDGSTNIESEIPGVYKIIPTGFLVDLVTLKPEMTAILRIDNEEFYRKSTNNTPGNWEGKVKEYDIRDANFLHFLSDQLNVEGFLPSGAVAVAEGIHYYFEQLEAS